MSERQIAVKSMKQSVIIKEKNLNHSWTEAFPPYPDGWVLSTGMQEMEASISELSLGQLRNKNVSEMFTRECFWN